MISTKRELIYRERRERQLKKHDYDDDEIYNKIGNIETITAYLHICGQPCERQINS